MIVSLPSLVVTVNCAVTSLPPASFTTAVPLIVFAARCGKKSVIAAVILLVLVTGGVVGIEFMIDRSDVNNIILYCLYVLLLAVPVAAGLIFRTRSERA